MAKLFAVYQQPTDPAAFDSYYFTKHVPLATDLASAGVDVMMGETSHI